jgi:hypothetical protein
MLAKNLVFTFSKMFENVLFFAYVHLKFAKSANITSNKLIISSGLCSLYSYCLS